MPSLNGTRRRHSKQPSSSSSSLKKGSTSVISAVSNSSTSSSATVTSRSIFQSSLRPSKRPGGKREPAQLPEPHHGLTANVDKQQLNVFAFMEHEEGDYNSEDAEDKGQAEHTPEELPSSAPSSERLADLPQKSPRYSHLEVRAIQDGVQRAWGRASLHSDSGISVRSPSPDQESPILQHKFKLPTVLDEQDTQEGDARVTHGLQLTRDPSNDPNPAFSHGNWPLMESDQDQYLETYYAPSPPHSAQTAQNPGGLMPEHSPRLPNQLVRGMSRQEIQQQRPSKCGYEFLASNIHAKGDALLKPIYRKFETLNNRMLLYLQDEISEMEDHLREIDNAIAHGEQGTDGRPASRRAEAKSPSQLQWHRLDLLGRSFAKIEQYNRALTSYGNLTATVSPASSTDISAYRAWLTRYAPIAESETAFLDQEDDLLAVSPRTRAAVKATSNFRTGTALETPVVVVAFGLLCTVIVFKVVPQILARLIISAVVGVACLCTMSPDVSSGLGGLRDWSQAIATYSAVMGLLAVVVS